MTSFLGPGRSQGPPRNNGFVADYVFTLAWESRDPSWSVLPGTVATVTVLHCAVKCVSKREFINFRKIFRKDAGVKQSPASVPPSPLR